MFGTGPGVSRVCALSTSSLYSVMLGLGIEAVRTTTVEAPTWKRARRRSALEAEHRRERERKRFGIVCIIRTYKICKLSSGG